MKTKLILSFAALSALPATAATRTWDGGDATANMTAAANWNGNTAINPAVDELFFPSGLALADRTVSNNFAANTLFRQMQFNDSYTLGGTIMGLDGGLLCFHNVGTTVTVNAGLSLQDTVSLNTSTGNLVFGAASQIFLGGHLVSFGTLFPSGNTTVGGVLAGGGQILVNGEGTVRFSGAKTFTAPVGIGIGSGGTLIVDDAIGLGTGAGHTEIGDGTLVLDSAGSMTIPERILMTNTNPLQSRLLSQGGAHTLSGPIEFSGDWFKRFEVQGPSLTLSGVISGPDSFGSMTKQGPGRLILSGAASNTAGIQIFGINAGEVFLNKSGGATAIASPFIILGTNAVLPHNSILRLGASHQIADATRVDLGSDGWFDLNGRQETIASLQFRGSGHVTGNGGMLRLEGGVYAFSAAQNGGEAVIDGALTLAAANSEWKVDGGAEDIDLTVNGTVTSLAPGGVLTKTGTGELFLSGTVVVPQVLLNDGRITMNGNSPSTHVTVNASILTDALYATGTLGDVTALSGGIIPGPSGTNATLNCGDLSITGPGEIWLTHTSALPGEHDRVNVTGTVTLSNATLNLFALNPAVLVAGEEMILISNDGADPVVGGFAGFPEGYIFTNGLGEGNLLSYKGGDGNDISLTHIVVPTGVTRLWDGGSAVDSNWMTAANWNPNGVPQPGDDLVFPTVAARKANVNNLPAGTTFNSVTVHGTGYTLGGNGITLNEKVEFTSSSGSHFFSLPLTLALDATISLTGNAFIQATAPILLNGNTLTLHNAGGGTGDLLMTGNISGDGQVSKTGQGQVTWNNNSVTYQGATSVQAGALVLCANASPGGPGGGTTIDAGATIELRSTVDGAIWFGETFTLRGRILVNAGNSQVTLQGIIQAAAETATIEVNGNTLHTGTITGSVLHKTGTGLLTINVDNTLNGGLFVDAGELRTEMLGTGCDCPITIGASGVPATFSLGWGNQVKDDGVVILAHPSAVFDLGHSADTIGALVMNGGAVTGTAAGRLTLGVLNVQANAATAVIGVPIASKPGSNGILQVADGAATTDLRLNSAVFGAGFDKTGAGRVDFMAEIPLAGLDLLNLQEGASFFFNDSRNTAIHLNGGLLGGNGTVGNISSITGGTIAPGASPGVLGGNIGTWNAATTLRMELNGPAPGAEYDQYFVNSELNLGSTALALSVGFDPAPGTEFMIVRNVGGSPIAGTFAGIPQNGYVSTAGAKVFRINYAGGDGDDVVLIRVDVTAPEITEYSVTPGVGDNKGYNEIHIGVKGVPGLTYLLESSTDLQGWTAQGSQSADLLTGLISYDLLMDGNLPRLFFRARLP